MAKQVSLDAWHADHMARLLQKGAQIVEKTNRPIVLYRQTIEDEEDSHEEVVCTLSRGYVIEQRITSGGDIVPTIGEQRVYQIGEYPAAAMGKSKERFLEIIDMLERQLG